MRRASQPRSLVDEHPSFTISDLRKAGALEGAGLAAPIPIPGSERPLEIRRLAPEQLEIRHTLGGKVQREAVGIGWVSLPFGARPHFLCPINGHPCSRLYYLDGRLGSRRGHGLSYRSQRQDRLERTTAKAEKLVTRLEGSNGQGAVRGGRRRRTVSALGSTVSALIRAGEIPSDLVRVLEWERERASRKRRRVRPRRGDSAMLTRSALYTARTLAPLPSHRVHQLLDALWKPDEAGAPLLHTSLPASRNHHAELELRRLEPKPGFASGHQLFWPHGNHRAGLQALTRVRGDGLEIWIEDGLSGQAISQSIAIDRAGREAFLICPINGTRHRKLFYRAGQFASASALKIDRRP